MVTTTMAPITAIAIIHPMLRPVEVFVVVGVGVSVPDVIDDVGVGVVVTCPESTGAGVVVGVVIDGGIYITLKTVKWLT